MSARVHYEPHAYQRACTQAILDKDAVALWVEMGLGKTAATLYAAKQLLYDACTVARWLIVAPKKVAEATWQDEIDKWDFCEGLTYTTVMGTRTQRTLALSQKTDFYITNRDNLVWLVRFFGRNWPFDGVILDEASSYKSHSAQRTKAIKQVRGRITKLVELTGTPMPNDYMDLWSQIYLLDRGERLGKYITRYRERWFYPTVTDSEGHPRQWAPRPGATREIDARLRDITISIKAADHLRLEELTVDDIPVELSPTERKQYDRFARQRLMELDGSKIKAAQAITLTGKLLQLCAGAVYDEAGVPHQFHRAKLDAFNELIDALDGQNCLVFYVFRFDRDNLLAELKTRHRGLRAAVLAGDEQAAAWNRGEIDVLLAQPASCAYGLNLQRGGHHIIWYTLPWSLEQYQQANARLHRQGQTHPVIVHRLLVRAGADQLVAGALERKTGCQDALMEGLRTMIAQARGAGRD